jgi:hemin uptake protein HemP
MDRQAMDYREAAATSPLGGTSNNASAQPAARPILQHRRADGQVTGVPVSHANANQGAARNVQTVSLQSILKGAREAIIDFDGAAYRLRITRNHRLILTK